MPITTSPIQTCGESHPGPCLVDILAAAENLPKDERPFLTMREFRLDIKAARIAKYNAKRNRNARNGKES